VTVPAAPSAVEPFDAVDVIAAKRDGAALTDAQIDWVVDAYTRGVVAEEQMSALAMAIYLRGMSRAEITRWTGAMIASGERMDFSGLGRPTADKHSTGGVGDKITLPLAPLVAVFGVSVPQLSGRGLGHTGGTLDKMESIPGWRADLTGEDRGKRAGRDTAVSTSGGVRGVRTAGARSGVQRGGRVIHCHATTVGQRQRHHIGHVRRFPPAAFVGFLRGARISRPADRG